MEVTQAVDGLRIRPDHLYVIPPGKLMAVEQGLLKLSPLDAGEQRPYLPVDFLLGSLAAERGRQAVGLLLSGKGTDGTLGLRAIREHGGITLAQDPVSARFDEMPRSAVEAGLVDRCLEIPALGAELVRLAGHPYLARGEPIPPSAAATAFLDALAPVLGAATGVDFTEYQPATLLRRAARRMALRKAWSMPDYLEALRADPEEVRALLGEILARTSSFSRDWGSFEEVRSIAIPEILRQKAAGGAIRAWVVGCGTGEEVYALAIALVEQVEALHLATPVLVFGSDLGAQAILEARAGTYPEAALHGLGEERLKRFFVRSGQGWRVGQPLRERCVFVQHDVANDPPFSHLDLICCRHVLGSFGQPLQRRVMAAAHHSLNQPGYLLLDPTEEAGGASRWFTATRHGGRLFLRKAGPSTFHFDPRSTSRWPGSGSADRAGLPAAGARAAVVRRIDDLVLARYAPPGVVVDERLEVIEFRGRPGPYLETPEGAPQRNLLKLVRAGLVAPLRRALAKAARTSAPVQKAGLVVEAGPHGLTCDLVVLPLEASEGTGRTFAVLFEERPRSPSGRRGASRPSAEPTGQRAPVTSFNDDLASGNEALRGLNEELETAKEELQSSNEELSTLNEQLRERNRELKRVGADVLNLLEAVEIPFVMLDANRCLRRFTSRAANFLGLRPTDVGRPITDLALPVLVPDLEIWIMRTMESGIMVEAEVHDDADRWHRLQIRVRRGPDGKVDGTILSLVDIDKLRTEVEVARWARDYARSIVEAVQVPLVVLDPGLRVLSSNVAYRALFREEATGSVGTGFFELDGGAWGSPELRRAVSGLGSHGRFQSLEVEREVPVAGRRTLSVSGCAVATPTGEPMVLLAIEDVTARRRGERQSADRLVSSEAARGTAERADHAKDLFLSHLSRELRTPLTSILAHAHELQRDGLEAGEAARGGAAIELQARRQARLVDDLLDLTGIAAGKLRLAFELLDWGALVAGGVEAARASAAGRAIELSSDCLGVPAFCRGDRDRLEQVVAALVDNAIKFTPSGGRVEVRVDAVDGSARLRVTDSGRGIGEGFLPHLFERFAREGDSAGQGPGLGLGLAMVRELVTLHGGSVQAESPGRDLGTTFTVLLPRQAPLLQ
jgi:two-component system CheB/CheR fusion protein